MSLNRIFVVGTIFFELKFGLWMASQNESEKQSEENEKLSQKSLYHFFVINLVI